MTTDEVRDILRMSQQPVSLENPVGDEEESELGDFVEDEQAESPFDWPPSLRQQASSARWTSLPSASARSSSCASG